MTRPTSTRREGPTTGHGPWRSVVGRAGLAVSAIAVALAGCTSSGDEGAIGIPGAPNPTIPPSSQVEIDPGGTDGSSSVDDADGSVDGTGNRSADTDPGRAEPTSDTDTDDIADDGTGADGTADGDDADDTGSTQSAPSDSDASDDTTDGAGTDPDTAETDAETASEPEPAEADPVPTTDAGPEIVYLRAGDEGPDISILQLKLRTAGFLDAGYTDGVFDRATNAAVLAFQGQYGLVVDGVVGPETQRALTAAALSVDPDG